MIGGIFAMSAFHLADTWFVSRLGTDALAAIGFTFPVMMLVFSVAMGLGTGAGSVISRAIGEQSRERARRLTTDSLILSVIVVGLFSIAGLLLMDPIFRFLGAPERLLPMIRNYMTIWLTFVAVLIIPMIGNNAIRATGDTFTPGVVMVAASLMNVALDPILIFGLFGFPKMGIAGASTSTVISRFLTLIVSYHFLRHRHDLIDFSIPRISRLVDSWKRILHVALPSVGTYLLMPLCMALITKIVAKYGDAAVAGIGAGSRIQHFAYVVPIAMGTTLIPFVGQNWGGGRHDRVREGWRFSAAFGIAYGLVCFVLAIPLAKPLAGLFSDDPRVIKVITHFLWIIFLGSGLQHVSVHAGFALNAIGKPFDASALMVVRLVVFMLPLAYIGSVWFGLDGLISGLSSAQIMSGAFALYWIHRQFPKYSAKHQDATGKES